MGKAVLLFFAVLARAKILFMATPPKGFNSFDSYPAEMLNDSSVAVLAQAQREQLLPAGYDYFVIDGGWTTSTERFSNGTTYTKQHLDDYGRPVAAPRRYKDMKALADMVHSKGLKLGLWTIRGAHADAVARKLPIKGTNYTIDQIIDQHTYPDGSAGDGITSGRNLSCLWAKEWLGINASHPAAQAYYNSRVELLASYGVDFIKADCMMCQPCYTEEINLFSKVITRPS